MVTSGVPGDTMSPALAGRSDTTPLTLRVLGPAGEWKVASVRGATVEPSEGRVRPADDACVHGGFLFECALVSSADRAR